MLKNHFKIAWRSLIHNKGFSLINIVGLAIGMTSAMLIFLWINSELGFDRFHEKTNSLYIVYNCGVFGGELKCGDQTPAPLGPVLGRDFADIKRVARTSGSGGLISYRENSLNARGMYIDTPFLSMFSFPLVQGDSSTALKDPNAIIITESLAEKVFGDEEPLNKIIKIENGDNFKVTGVLKDLPANTKFRFDYLLSWEYLKRQEYYEEKYWSNNSYHTYVELQPHASEEAVNRKIADVIKRHDEHAESEVFLHPAGKWHLYSEFENGKIAGGRIEVVRLMSLLAVFILLIACINFMNLSTARGRKRAKEVGVRKVIGAQRGSLIAQFTGESVLLSFLAGLLALVLAFLFLPAFNSLTQKHLAIEYADPWFWLMFLCFILITGLLAGSYPSFYLSSFQPAKTLKGLSKQHTLLWSPRRALIVFQFTISIMLIISTLIIRRQVQFAQDRDPGYESKGLVFHWMRGDIRKNYELIKNELLNSGAATAVSKTSSPLTSSFSNTWMLEWKGSTEEDKRIPFDQYFTTGDFIKTTGVKLMEGRDIDLQKYRSDSTACMLSETAVEVMGFDEPIGQIIKKGGRLWQVVGVFKDFVWRSPYQTVPPMFVMGGNGWFSVINFRLNDKVPLSASLQKAEDIFKKYNPAFPFEYKFVDQTYARKFADQQRTAKLSTVFAFLSILVSCLGLFGLAAYMAINRTKEIGIRKVLGASAASIAALLSKDFIKPVLIAIAIATPAAWYIMNRWLQDFAYRIQIQGWVFVIAGLLAVAIAMLTVSFQSVKAALRNPVKSLRSE